MPILEDILYKVWRELYAHCKGDSMAAVKGIRCNCEGNAPECLVSVPGLAGILAEYLVFDPDPAAGWLREGGPPRPPHPNHFKRFKRLDHFGSILAKSQRYLALKTEGYTVAIRGGNEVNTKRKRQYMQYVQFPMLNCEGNTLPKCEGDPMQMTAYPGGYPVQSVKGTIFTL